MNNLKASEGKRNPSTSDRSLKHRIVWWKSRLESDYKEHIKGKATSNSGEKEKITVEGKGKRRRRDRNVGGEERYQKREIFTDWSKCENVYIVKAVLDSALI